MTETQSTATNRINPFLLPYDTPHHTVPFHLIKDSDFEPALMEGMKREDAEINAITNNPSKPTFSNTVLALEHSGELLNRVETVLGNLLSACSNPQLETLAQKISPLLAEHSNKIMFNTTLFYRVKAVKDSRPHLTDEEQTLLDKVYEGFTKRGVGLSKKKKEQLTAISQELSVKTLQFSQNILNDTNRFHLMVEDESELAGLPGHQKELARASAEEWAQRHHQKRAVKGWLFTLQAPSYAPVLTYCDNRQLRRKMWVAHNTLCIHNNKNNNLDLARDIINLRLESARLHGYHTYADAALKDRMAEKTPNVNRFLRHLLKAYKPAAISDYQAITDYARKIEGDGFKLMPWDVAYYSHKLQLERYHFDAEMLRPYFELSNVIKGVFGLATKLYGITFRRNTDIPVYHKDVVAYEVFDKDGSYLAVLYADFHPRESKKSGAWMTSYQEQWITDQGENIRPHVSLCMNLTKPTPTKPSLLTLGEVSTFLHEFGHGLHEIFSQCRFQSLSGTNVYWDFVELPSQFMENYALEKEFLKTFAFHYQTGEVIPDELVDSVISARHFNAGMACLRQLSFCLLDMAYYTRKTPLEGDIIEFEKEAWKDAIVGPQSRVRTCMTTQFSHIITGGYSAGYYCYKWAEVLDADAFSVFQKEGLFNPDTAARFRHEILEKGNTRHPKELYRNFRHGDATIQAMLRRDGIISPGHRHTTNNDNANHKPIRIHSILSNQSGLLSD